MSQATLRDLCAEAVAIEGTGAATFLGALRGHRSFADAYAGVLPLAGVNIKIEEANSHGYIVRWENSTCTVSETGFTRITCISSSNNNAFVEFGTGYKLAFVFIPVADVGGGGGGDITASQITDSTTAGRAILTATDASAQRTALALGTLATQSGTFSGTSSGTNTGDQTNITGITGTKAQFDTAVTDGNFSYVGDAPASHTHALADLTQSSATTGQVATWGGSVWAPATPSGGMSIGGAISGYTQHRLLFASSAGVLSDNSALKFNVATGGLYTQDITFNSTGTVTSVGGNISFFVGSNNELNLSAQEFRARRDSLIGFSQFANNQWYLEVGFARENSTTVKVSIGSFFGGGLANFLALTTRTQTYTLSALNSAIPSPTIGQRAFITDETTGTFGASSVGGGSLERPVFYGNGAWRNG